MKGFTLVETLVAVAIIALAVTAPLYSASRSIIAAQTASLQLTATHLAQEGVEHVRMMRDNEYLKAYLVGGASISDTAWDNFKNADPLVDYSSIKNCFSPNFCTIDPWVSSGSPVAQCPGGSCTPLYLTSATGQYTQTGGAGKVLQPFVRSIQAFSESATDVRVDSTVTWSYHGINFTVTASVHLTPWQ